MAILQILKAWILTILIGSILIGSLFSTLAAISLETGGWNDFLEDLYFFIKPISIFSGLFSIPTIILLIVLNEELKSNDATYKQFKLQLTIAHILLGLITFAVLFFMGIGDLDFVIVLAASFISIGTILLRIEINKAWNDKM